MEVAFGSHVYAVYLSERTRDPCPGQNLIGESLNSKQYYRHTYSTFSYMVYINVVGVHCI